MVDKYSLIQYYVPTNMSSTSSLFSMIIIKTWGKNERFQKMEREKNHITSIFC